MKLKTIPVLLITMGLALSAFTPGLVLGQGAASKVAPKQDRGRASTRGGSAKKDAGSIDERPPKSDAGSIAERLSKYPVGQKFRSGPSVIPDTDSVTFKFVTTQPTIPIIEVSKRPPEPGPRFNKASIVSAVFPVLAGKQTRHNLRVGNLNPGTRYYYIITIADEEGKLITETGEFSTSVRID